MKIFLLMTTLGLAAPAAHAQLACGSTEDGELTVQGSGLDRYVVDMSGSRVVVAGQTTRGVAVFRREGGDWIQEFFWTAPRIGVRVAIDGDVMVVGDDDDDDAASNAGAVHVFRHDGLAWGFEQKLTAPDAAPGATFGQFVDVSGSAILVGAIRDDDLGEFTGAAYVFRDSGSSWEFEQKILPRDAAADQFFGGWLALDGDTALIGRTRPGGSLFFRHQNGRWEEEDRVTPPPGASGFGCSQDIDGDRAVIGAKYARLAPGEVATGTAIVYRRQGSSWVEEQVLRASDAVEDQQYGSIVRLKGDLLVVSASNDFRFQEYSGAVYVLRLQQGEWREQKKLTASRQIGFWRLGLTAATNGEFVVSDQFGYPYWFRIHALSLTAQPGTVAAGEVVTLSVCGGAPTLPSLVALISVDGVPCRCPVAGIAPFALDGIRTLTGTVPGGFPGTYQFQALALDPSGTLVQSGTETLVIE